MGDDTWLEAVLATLALSQTVIYIVSLVEVQAGAPKNS
jgi:hypothetical protein